MMPREKPTPQLRIFKTNLEPMSKVANARGGAAPRAFATLNPSALPFLPVPVPMSLF